jgi:predicted Zn-dependent protease
VQEILVRARLDDVVVVEETVVPAAEEKLGRVLGIDREIALDEVEVPPISDSLPNLLSSSISNM